jgi:hypothetical protein
MVPHMLRGWLGLLAAIVFDKRGQGLSDRVAEQTLDERIGDVRAVMDAAGSERGTSLRLVKYSTGVDSFKRQTYSAPQMGSGVGALHNSSRCRKA